MESEVGNRGGAAVAAAQLGTGDNGNGLEGICRLYVNPNFFDNKWAE
jgi:hypothetical protein